MLLIEFFAAHLMGLDRRKKKGLAGQCQL